MVLRPVSRLCLSTNQLPRGPDFSYVSPQGSALNTKHAVEPLHCEKSLKALKSSEFSDANLCWPSIPQKPLVLQHWPEERCRLTSAIHYELVHATGAQGGSHSLRNHLAGTDVTYKLGDALRTISPFFQQDNWCGLEKKNHLLQWDPRRKGEEKCSISPLTGISGGLFKPHSPSVHRIHSLNNLYLQRHCQDNSKPCTCARKWFEKQRFCL